MKGIFLLIVAALILTNVVSCVGFGPSKPALVPMPVSFFQYAKDAQQDTAVVFLPGLGDSPQDFVDNGFVAELWKTRKADVWIPDAHLGYYQGGTVLTRLEADVFAPIRAKGYKHVILVGISMGGGGSLLSARTWPEWFETVVFIAPFLGDGDLIGEISGAGIKKWVSQPVAGRSERDVQFRTAWQWLQKKMLSSSAPSSPSLLLAFGDHDRLRSTEDILASILPPEQVITAPGGHDWPTWKTLWIQVLQKLKTMAP